MTLKKYEESRIAKPFNTGALMALTRLTCPDQLHPGPPACPGPRTRSQPPRPSPSLQQGQSPSPPQGGAQYPVLEPPTSWSWWWDRNRLGTPRGSRQPSPRVTNPPMQQSDIHKQWNTLSSLLWARTLFIYLKSADGIIIPVEQFP